MTSNEGAVAIIVKEINNAVDQSKELDRPSKASIRLVVEAVGVLIKTCLTDIDRCATALEKIADEQAELKKLQMQMLNVQMDSHPKYRSN